MIFNTLERAELIDELQTWYGSNFFASGETDRCKLSSTNFHQTIINKVQENVKQLMFMQRLTSFYLSAKDIQELLK